MDELNLQTIISFLEKHTKILIALPPHPTIDQTAAALALDAGLSAVGKTVTIAGLEVPNRLGFIPTSSHVKPLAVTVSQLVISVDTTHADLAELSYDTVPGKVSIYLRSKGGQFTPADISVSPGQPPFEVIVMLGVETPEQLGSLFTQNTELFYALPRINIDTSPRNENHGTLNLVQVTTSTVSELVYHVLAAIREEQSVPPAATSLLTGILSSTDSLRSQRTTPDTFAVVADLIAAGADYGVVVKHLFKTERLGFLKLWGRSLARVKVLESGLAAFSILLPADFEKTGEGTAAAGDLLEQLHEHVADMLTLVLAVPEGSGTKLIVIRNSQLDVDALAHGVESTQVELGHLDTGLEIVTILSPIAPDHIEPALSSALNSALPTIVNR